MLNEVGRARIEKGAKVGKFAASSLGSQVKSKLINEREGGGGGGVEREGGERVRERERN